MTSSSHLKVIRLNYSRYHTSDFLSREKSVCQQLNITYDAIQMSSAKELEAIETKDAKELILVTNTHTPIEEIPQQILNKTPLIIHPNSGYDNFSPSWLSNNEHLDVLCGNEIRAHAVAEYIISHLLSRFALSPHQPQWEPTRKWSRGLLKNESILVIGAGHIGQILTKALHPLCKNLHCFDPFVLNSKNEDLENYAKKCRIVVLAASLNPSSQSMINETLLSLLPKNYLLINAARGALIDQKSLIRSLTTQNKAHAVLDVFENEPFTKEFSEVANVTLSSHIAGVYSELDDSIINFVHKVTKNFVTMKRDDFWQHFSKISMKNKIKNSFLI